MAKELAKTLKDMNSVIVKMTLLCSFFLVYGLIISPKTAHAAIGTTTQNWPATPIYAAAGYPSAAITYNAVAGNNRLLVVGISSSSSSVAQAQPTVTYGGTAMTAAVGYSATATQQHSYLFYLPIGSSATADTGKTIVVTISGGSSVYCNVNAAVYTGVDQTSPVAASVRSSNNATAGTTVGPFTLTVNSGELGISILNTVTTSRSNASTITLGTTGHIWTQVSTAASGKLIGALRTTFATTSNANTTSATQHTSSLSTLNSTAAITIKPIVGIAVGDGPTVGGNKSFYVGDANTSNIVVDTFTMSAGLATTVSNITFTANAATTSSKISTIKIWRKVGPTLTAYETNDALIGSAAANGGAVTIGVNNEPVGTSTQNYIVTYDINNVSAAASTTTLMTGTVTAITPAAITLTDTLAYSSSIYIYPTTTIGNGSEPANTRLWKGSAPTNLDAFILSHNSTIAADNDTITSVTVTLAPAGISGGGAVLSKISNIEVVSADGLTTYGNLTSPTTGDIWNIPTITNSLSVTSSPTTYYVRVTTAADIVPGLYTVSGTITSVVHSNSSNKLTNSDSGSATHSIDIENPNNPATFAATTTSPATQPGGKIDLSWTAAAVFDPNSGLPHATTPYIVKRSVAGGVDPAPYCTDGTTAYQGNAVGGTVTFMDSALNDTSAPIYHYRICTMDSLGNISAGITSSAPSSYTNYCDRAPDVAVGSEDPLNASVIQDQIIRTQGTMAGDTTPFLLQVTNNDIGVCPNVTFNISLVDVSTTGGSCVKCDATDPPPSLADFSVTYPASVLLGKTAGPGGTNKTGTTEQVKIYGLPTADQIQKYKFRVQVSATGHPTVLNKTSDGTMAYATGILNDMPPIVHNANNMAKYQYGTWGNEYTCATCHSNSTTNIKGIYQVISTPIGHRNVVFNKHSGASSAEWAGLYSNDQRPTKNVSNNVCSVCHHKTRQHQYSANKSTGGPVSEPYNADHHNGRDCVKCHTHNTAFRSILGACGDCHGFKGTNYAPVSKGTMVKQLTNALGTSPPSYGAHQAHNNAQMSCAVCHSNTNHGLNTDTWFGDNLMEMGFKIDNTTFPGYNPAASKVGGTFEGTQNLNSPYVWTAGPGTTITQVVDYNASCSTYCHGGWSGNVGSNTKPNWVGTGQAACGTCHNATAVTPPVSGSHAMHAGTGTVRSGVTGLGIACAKCHNSYTQAQYTGSKHINGNVQWSLDMSGYPVTTGTYNGVASGSTGASAPTDPAAYKTCASLYCHSNVQGVGGSGGPGSYAAPKWGDNNITTDNDSATAYCGSCHIYPNTVGGHAQHESAENAFSCQVCHYTGGRTSPAKHANGTVDFKFTGLAANTVYKGISTSGTVTPGTGYGSCSNSDCHGRYTRTWQPATTTPLCEKCHGSRTSARGFYNTRGPDGTLSIYSAAIGVHDIHLQNPNSPRKATFARFTSYAAGMNCNQCHYNPTSAFSPGHMDTPLPAEVPFAHMSSLANTGKTKFSYYSSPVYGSGTCSNVWCHGAGMNSNNATGPYAGLSRNSQRTNPKWDQPFLTGNGANDCTKCHAMPPQAPDSNYIHFGQTQGTCKDCHVHLNDDGYGFKNKSLHINGKIDGGCTNCHGYPPVTNVIGAADGLATPDQGALKLGTAGAHSAHILNANIGKACRACHYNYNPLMTSDGSGRLEIGFNAFNGAVTTGTFVGYSNADLHPKLTSTNSGTVIQKVTNPAAANVCSNLYCHGGGTGTLPALGGGSKTTPNWEGGSPDASCGTCHGTDTTNAPTGGSHTRHALATNGGVGMLCSACHGFATNMSHVNASVSWKLDRTNPAIGADATYNNLSSGSISGLAPRNNGTDYRTCSNIYCHSDVQSANGAANPTTYKTPRWGADNNTLDCGSCHKNMATDASPTGSHLKHANTGAANMALNCGYCHQDGGDGTINHADNMVFVNFTGYVGGTYSLGTPYLNGKNKTAGSAAYGTCSVTFCHGTAASPAWGTSGPLACNKCHGATADKTLSPSWSGRHTTHYNYSTLPTVYNDTLTDLSSSTKYRFNCKHCHDADGTKHSLKPYSSTAYARVFFGITSAGTSARRGKYAYGAAQGATDNGFKYTSGSCNTSYCHSDGKKGNPLNTALTWTTTPTTPGSNCAYCHDTKSTTSTASKLSPRHDKHMNPTNNTMIGIGNGFNCVDCHARTITNTSNTVIANKTNHVNAMLDYSGAKAGKNFDATGKVCSSVYCHSNGNPNAPVFVSMTGQKAWNGSTTFTTCNRCHGRSNAIGYPDYANGAANAATSNLHQGHLAGMTDTTSCADCHRKTPDTITANKFRPYSTLHLSGSPNVNFNVAKSYIGTKANVAVAGFQVTCSGIICHGQGAPVWGASTTANTCQKCHGSRSTAFVTYSSPQVAPGYGSDGTDTSMTKKAPTDPRVGAHQKHLTANVISTNVKCGECHVSVTNMRSGNHWNYSTATLTFNGRATANSHTPTPSRTSGIISCSNTYCHTGKSNSGTTIAPFWNMTGLVKEGTLTVASCNKCHGFPPKTVGAGGTALSYDHTALADPASFPVTTCTGCHSNMSNSGTTYSDIFVNKSLHVNGAINASGGHAFPYPGASHMVAAGTTPWATCTSCHTNGNNSTYPVAAGTAPDCTGCHKLGLKTPSGTLSCYDCHGATATDGMPNGVAFPNYSGSHTIHVVGQSLACTVCHNNSGGGGTDTKHGFSNRTAHDITFVNVTSITAQFKFSWTGKGSCSNIACHGTAEWGTKLGCDSCHSYDTIGGTWGSVKHLDGSTAEGWGAHAVHIDNLKAKYGITLNAAIDTYGSANFNLICGACHSQLPASHTTNGSSQRLINFNGSTAYQFGPSIPVYNGASGTPSATQAKTCSNISCHFGLTPRWQ